MKPIRHARHGSMLSLLAAAVLAACGGGADDGTATTREHALAVAASKPKAPKLPPFPAGVVLASPTAVVTQQDLAPVVLTLGDQPPVLPPGIDPPVLPPVVEPPVQSTGVPAFHFLNGELRYVLDDMIPSPSRITNLGNVLNDAPADAGCHGPSIAYVRHDDGPDATPARLPGGSLGLWLPADAAGTPCAAAQMNSRLRSASATSYDGLLWAASLASSAARSRQPLPARGQTLTLTTQFSMPPDRTLNTATITHEPDDSWTYAVSLTTGQGADARTTLYRLHHVPLGGGNAQKFSGVLQYAVMGLGTDAASGCGDELASEPGPSPVYKVSTAGTLRYERAGTGKLELGAREARYCGHAPAGSTDLAAVAALTPQGELDPARALPGDMRNGATGWRGNFMRYGAGMNPSTLGGSFVLAWQAGPQDSHSRMLAVQLDAKGSKGLAGSGYYAWGERIDAAQGSPLGMICNWAGPGSRHVPQPRFQSQPLAWAPQATGWTSAATGARLAYAPTNSCSASANMQFDVDADGVLAPGEGSGFQAALDAPRGHRSVAQELKARGLTRPALF